MNRPLYFLLALLLPFAALAQPKADRDAIKSMCGCYEVTFKFAETFSPVQGYKLHEPHRSIGLELAELVEDSPNKISLQHLLVVGVGDSDVVKHWRQDWEYQAPSMYTYARNNTWDYQTLAKGSNKGQWVQRVFQVDDGPRYEASATWIHADGRHYWESFADAPLPRREHTLRSDYNVLHRRNRQELTSYGWIHEQDNDKLKRSAKGDTLLASEKGYNEYRKVPIERCQVASNWWKKNQAFYAKVRTVWAKYYGKNQDFTLEKVVDGKPLYVHFYGMPNTATEAEIEAVIAKFYRPADPLNLILKASTK